MLPDKEERNLLIENYLNGKLKDIAAENVEANMDSDQTFGSEVAAGFAVKTYMEMLEAEEALRTDLDLLLFRIARRPKQAKVTVVKREMYLIQLLVASIFLFFGVSYILNKNPAVKQVSVAFDEDTYGLVPGSDSLRIAFFDRKPGFWRLGEEYKWKGDTLQIFGRHIENAGNDWIIRQSDYSNQYELEMDGKVYRIIKKRNFLTPLLPAQDEK